MFVARNARHRMAESAISERKNACRTEGFAAMPCCRRIEEPTIWVARIDTN
jgi:hypothetical protein